jgi:type IV secretion system protein VirB5
MAFRRTLQRYGLTAEPETPYQRAGQLWDERIGSARVQARNWRLMSFGSLVLAIALAGGLIWQSTQSRVTPYVVQVDKFGAVQAVGPAVQNYTPTDAEIAWYLARFVTDVRSLSIDPVVVRRNWLEAYDYATDHGAVFLNQYAQTNDPFKAVGERTVSVQVTSVVRVSDNSFQVKWTEQIFEHDTLAKTERWTAILSIVTKQPASAETLKKNPLGLYVNGVNWSRELDN